MHRFVQALLSLYAAKRSTNDLTTKLFVDKLDFFSNYTVDYTKHGVG